jgi:integration host factor subunit beta
MTKADLIEEVSRVVEMTRKESEVIVEAIFDSIVKSLRTGDKIEIRGFGSFRTRQRQPRIGRNPKTGARVEVPAKKIPYFKPSKELKDVVNNSASPAPAGSVPPAPAPEQVPNPYSWTTFGLRGGISTSPPRTGPASAYSAPPRKIPTTMKR